jgi:hypothetical protein
MVTARLSQLITTHHNKCHSYRLYRQQYGVLLDSTTITIDADADADEMRCSWTRLSGSRVTLLLLVPSPHLVVMLMEPCWFLMRPLFCCGRTVPKEQRTSLSTQFQPFVYSVQYQNFNGTILWMVGQFPLVTSTRTVITCTSFPGSKHTFRDDSCAVCNACVSQPQWIDLQCVH